MCFFRENTQGFRNCQSSVETTLVFNLFISYEKCDNVIYETCDAFAIRFSEIQKPSPSRKLYKTSRILYKYLQETQ